MPVMRDHDSGHLVIKKGEAAASPFLKFFLTLNAYIFFPGLALVSGFISGEAVAFGSVAGVPM